MHPTRREALAAPLAAATGGLRPPLAGITDTPKLRFCTFAAEVTPPVGHPLMGGGIAPAKEVVDPLFAHGFVLQGMGKPVAVVAVDWCEIRNAAYDRWRSAVAEAVGTEPVRVLVTCLHQHDAPIADLDAEELLRRHKAGASVCDPAFHEKAVSRVAKAATDSLAAARPVTHVGTGRAKVEDVASNRRYLGAKGEPRYDRMSATRDPKVRAGEVGTIDPYLKTLSFWDGDTPLLALSAYAVHPMSYYGKGGVSADFVGLARRRRQADTPGVFHLYASGCSGNVTAGKYNDGSPDNRPVLADRLYKAMKAAWDATKRQAITAAEFRSVPLTLEPRASAGFSADELTKRLTTDPRPFGRCLAALGLSWRNRCAAGKPIDLCVLDFGSACFALLPAESYVEFQLAAQEQRPGGFVVVAGYGECGPGYIPIERAWQENDSNLADWCWVAGGSEQRMRAALGKLLGR
jgi:hypothetical protein